MDIKLVNFLASQVRFWHQQNKKKILTLSSIKCLSLFLQSQQVMQEIILKLQV